LYGKRHDARQLAHAILGFGGVEISRATMDGWVMRVGYVLSAIALAMRKEVLGAGYIQD
jgi:Na+-translocating ferredoxin:NAD+ oxidoreductase RnfE subunit